MASQVNSQPTEKGDGKANAIKVIAALALLAVAGVIYARTGKEDSRLAASRPADAVPPIWKCGACGHEFTLSFEELDRLSSEQAKMSAETPTEGDGAPRGVSRAQVVHCPKCKDGVAFMCQKCPDHGVVYPARNADGSRGVCPKCAAEWPGG